MTAGILNTVVAVATADPGASSSAGLAVDAGLSVQDIAMAVLGVAMVLAVIRLLRGPTLADRVVALDLLAFFSVGVVALAAVVSNRAELVIVSVVVALLTFMGTAAFALYLERKGQEQSPGEVRPGEVRPEEVRPEEMAPGEQDPENAQ